MKLLNILFPKLGEGTKRNVYNMRNWEINVIRLAQIIIGEIYVMRI